ncbi:hypothetical protein AMS68_002094 [Peltaster fructicola]|uniref:Pre-mRNA-splicing factor 18 n=1 Tax=Peltaster fructicola TaxID=286661 RepID=A0A6H0XP92_9PEZI|nr:hypothetical protein AMS68_002094 [Peltaster fructicola]
MDFASLMKAQIAKPKDSDNTPSKYIRRGDIEAQRREAYAKEQADLEAARLARLEKKRKRDDEEAERQYVQQEKKKRLAEESRQRREAEAAEIEAQRRKRLGLLELKPVEPETLSDDVPEEQLREQLHAMDEPRVLFGETHAQRLKRWRALVEAQKRLNMTDGPIPTTLELVEEKDMKLPAELPKDKDDRLYVHRQLASYFDLVLSEWDTALRRRTREVRESLAGRQAYGHYTAAVSNLVPLFRKLEANELPDDILKPILEIVNLAQSKRYVDANDAYLRLSIGNTAWPIGVTMVGIHERSAREKLHEDGVSAHIMSDESTRKMIQGIKRSLTFAQTRWPPDELGQLMG